MSSRPDYKPEEKNYTEMFLYEITESCLLLNNINIFACLVRTCMCIGLPDVAERHTGKNKHHNNAI